MDWLDLLIIPLLWFCRYRGMSRTLLGWSRLFRIGVVAWGSSFSFISGYKNSPRVWGLINYLECFSLKLSIDFLASNTYSNNICFTDESNSSDIVSLLIEIVCSSWFPTSNRFFTTSSKLISDAYWFILPIIVPNSL